MKQQYPDIGQQAAQDSDPYRKENRLGESSECPGNHTWKEVRGPQCWKGECKQSPVEKA